LIEKKVNKITKLSELNKLNSSTTKKLYEYNIIYGHNSNNIIKSYTPKLIQFGSKFKKKVDKGENIQIFSEEQIKVLFYHKCRDLNVPIKDELMNRFLNFIREKCINRIIDLTDCSLGINSMIILSEILRNNIEICSRIILTRNNFGDDGIELLLDSLKGNNNIVELNLCSNNLGVNGGMAIFNFLLDQKSIISLDLSSKEGLYRNRLCAEGIKLISNVLKNNYFLERIDLSLNSIKNEGMKYIANGLESNITLQSLIIPNNEINEKAMIYMESKLKVCKLRYLNISCNPISNEGIIALGNCLAGDKLGEIITLNITECSITFDGYAQFIKKISKNHIITTLICNRNNLASKKWHLLEIPFKQLSLKTLYLGSCNLGQYGKDIASIFKFSPTIRFLDLSHNQINDDNFEEFQTYPKDNLTLEELDLSNNFITDKGACRFFKYLEDNITMLKINFFNNHLENKSAEAIMNLLKTNRHLLSINLYCNNIGLKIMENIKMQIENNKMIEKGKYIPKLKNELKDLEFDPKEIGQLKNRIYYNNKIRENLEKKFIGEAKNLNVKKKDNMKKVKSIEYSVQKIEKQINGIQKEWNDIKDEEINDKDSFNNEMNLLKEKINEIEDEIKDINYTKYNLKHEYNEQIELLKKTYEKTLQQEQNIKISLISSNKLLDSLNNKYKKKLDYLENLKSSQLKKKNSGIKYKKESKLLTKIQK
jgi:Ran GTPase-activating protein (RanGAP) involved in mRNA processing and transport